MSAELISALFVFAFVASVTPGPNNLMLMASGANFGFRRTMPHMFGIAVGFNVMVVLLRMGLMGVFDAFPAMRQVLKVVSVAYLLWLAWKIANAAAPGRAEAGGKPLTFWQAAAFQWDNPKKLGFCAGGDQYLRARSGSCRGSDRGFRFWPRSDRSSRSGPCSASKCGVF